jgi:hypothetical protein
MMTEMGASDEPRLLAIQFAIAPLSNTPNYPYAPSPVDEATRSCILNQQDQASSSLITLAS